MRALAGLLLVLAAVSGCGRVATATESWNNGQFSFRYPSDWAVWGPDEPITLRRPELLAYVGNLPVDVGSICQVGTASASCHFDAYEMQPGRVVVGVVRWYLPTDRLPENGEPVQVGGRDARMLLESTERGSEVLTWTIDDPYGTYLVIRGEVMGPNAPALRDQLRALIASVQFSPPQ